MSTEIPIWVNGEIRWLSGIDKKTTCKDIVEVLLEGEGIDKSEVKDFTIMERWRKVERPLDENSKILKIWSHWGYEKKEVRLCLRRIDSEVDSGRGSPIGSGSTPSIRRKRNQFRGNGKPPWTHPEALHPRRLAELGTFNKKEYYDYYVRNIKPNKINDDPLSQNYLYHSEHGGYEEIYGNNENVNCRKKSSSSQQQQQKSYHCPSTGKLHSTPLADHTNSRHHTKKTGKCCSKRESKHKIRNSENIEKLMKLILAQGATIQSQLQKLKERDEQIESLEQERHRERIEKNGRNYLLETYLGSLKEAEIPAQMDEEERADDSGVNTEGGSDQMNAMKNKNLEELAKHGATELESNYYGVERLGQARQQQQQQQGEDAGERSYHHHHHHHHHHHNHYNHHHNYSATRGHQKSARSKSESRSPDSSKVTLKRTLSDNSLVNPRSPEENKFGCGENHVEQQTNSKAKDESEEVVELNKIQSQIHMWEKVFKINKKLEKEEENLVRLHIKIKKYQNENYRLAKERMESQEAPEVPVDGSQVNAEAPLPNNTEQFDCDDDNYADIQKNLELLKTNLDQNSKEIYENFTKLIEDDELVEQKRNCLTKLLFDLERTKHEEEMLNEMIAAREQEQYEIEHSVPDNNTNCAEQRQQQQQQTDFRFDDKLTSNVANSDECMYPNSSEDSAGDGGGDAVGQTATAGTTIDEDKRQLLKPKIVKISFEDQIQSCENLETDHDKSVKPTPVATGTLKGILKNRTQSYTNVRQTDRYNTNEPARQYQTLPPQNYHVYSTINNNNNNDKYGNNYYLNNGAAQNSFVTTFQHDDVPDQNAKYPRVTMCPLGYDQPLHESNQNYYSPPPVPSNYELKTAYSMMKSSNQQEISKTHGNIYPHSTMVKTKASVLNDNDSSTSSDTSGLCSMYSSSPSVEQPYMEHGYILDTLV